MPRPSLLASLSLALPLTAALACADGSDGIPFDADSGRDAGDGAAPSEHASEDAGGAPHDGATPGAAGLTVNEISGKGDEWIELVNGGAAPLDASGIGVTDSDDQGAPRRDGAVVLPKGTLLNAGEFLVLYGKGSSCPGAPRVCVPLPFGISDKSGDVIHIIAPDGALRESVPYPAATLASGQTWGRMPSVTGRFGATTATPNAPNAR